MLRNLIGHIYRVNDLAINYDGDLAISGAEDGLILWDLASGEQIHQFDSHQLAVADLSYTPDGLLVLSTSSFTNNVLLWDVFAGKKSINLRHPVHHMGWRQARMENWH